MQWIEQCWSEALEVWGVSTRLSPPEAIAGKKSKDIFHGRDPLAYIDLVTRQVHVNFDLLVHLDALSGLTAVLAHEIGHHVRFPHTMGFAAELELLQRRVLPEVKDSLTNLFFDLQINEVVGRRHAEGLCTVYRAVLMEQGESVGDLFAFYATVYEELWEQRLYAPEVDKRMEADWPGFRAEARMFCQTFYEIGDERLQFVYFCSVFSRYVGDGAGRAQIPLASDVAAPDLDDYAHAVRAGSRLDGVLERAVEEGWIRAAQAAQWGDEATAVFRDIGRLTGGHSPTGQARFRRALVSRHYRRLVEEHLFEVPLLEGDAAREDYLPSITVPWEWGDDPRVIDWGASVLKSGPLAAMQPLRRELLPDEPPALGDAPPAVEIFLDTSGSMANPLHSVNAMTLAAQILAAATIRAGGLVRAVVWSDKNPMVSKWMYDESAARDYLLHYAGGGTNFPFDVLEDFMNERSDSIRVIVSDDGFLHNVQEQKREAWLLECAERSTLVVPMLALPVPSQRFTLLKTALKRVREHPAFRVVPVSDVRELGKAASALSRALFGETI